MFRTATLVLGSTALALVLTACAGMSMSDGGDASHPSDTSHSDSLASDSPDAPTLDVADGGAHDAIGHDADAATPDVVTTPDVVAADTIDVGGPDVVVVDAVDTGPADGIATDGGSTTGTCAAPIDINSAGTLTGTTLDYAGSTASSPPDAPIPDTSCTMSVAYETVLQYTTRTASALNISLVNPGTDLMFDTVMWVMDACNTTGMNSLGCDDDSTTGRRSALLSTPVTAGETVYIVVAGYSPPTDPSYTDHGPFELTVTEIPAVAIGASCDPSGVTSVCVPGASCEASGGASTCIADGALGGMCLGTAPACGAGLGCDGDDICIAAVPAGGTCDPTGATTVCESGASCITGGAGSTCIVDGTLGGVCLSTTPACASGLGCNPSATCVPAVGVGGACDPDGVTSVCTAGAECSFSTSTCVIDGSLGAPCAGPSNECAAGLACDSTDTCVAGVALGGACDPAGVTNLCDTGLSCVTTGSTSTCHGAVPAAITAPVFIDACATGTDVTSTLTPSDDDGHTTAALTIPFAYTFFGVSYTQIWPDTNGYAVFGATPPADFFSGSVPNMGEGPLVAPYWQDLVVESSGGPAAAICWLTQGTAPSRQFVIEWRNVEAFATSDVSLTFEVVLHEGSTNIDFLYGTLAPTTGTDATRANGSLAAIGMQDATATDLGLYVGTVTSGQGIRFTPM